MKRIIKRYYQPTPIFWRKLGDSLLAVFSMASSFTYVQIDQTWGKIILITGILGKIITNFATEEPHDQNNQ